VAISVLRDQRMTYKEDFDGFTFTKFDGTRITVSADRGWEAVGQRPIPSMFNPEHGQLRTAARNIY
jgi:hypothetical protein